jgi:hypothetical protein
VITSVLMGNFLVYFSHHKLKTLPFFIYIFLIGPADFSTNHCEKIVMKKHIIILFLYLSNVALAQNSISELWRSDQFVGSGGFPPPTLFLDKNENSFVISKSKVNSSLLGEVLIKYDSLGQKVWDNSYSVSLPMGHLYSGSTVDQEGNAFVSLNPISLPEVDADYILMRYSPSGERIWVVSGNTNNTGDNFIDFADLDTLNGYLILLGGNVALSAENDNFIFVQAMDTTNGSTIWRTEIPGFFMNQNMRVLENSIQILATRFDTIDKYFVNVQLDFLGNIINYYEKKYYAYHLLDFNYISTTGDVIFGNRGGGYNVTRVNLLGDTIWAYSLPVLATNSTDKVLEIAEDNENNIYAFGSYTKTLNNTIALLSKFDLEGNLTWENCYTLSGEGYFNGANGIDIKSQHLVTSGISQDIDNK